MSKLKKLILFEIVIKGDDDDSIKEEEQHLFNEL